MKRCPRPILLFRLVCTFLLAAAAAVAGPARAAERTVADLDAGWRFVRADAPGSPEQAAFDDGSWQMIALPHTWNATDGADGPQTRYYRGVGWYRRHLRVDSSLARMSLFLRFDGAATVADVFVNGVQAGEHRGNFAAFCFDVTRLLRVGQDNVIAVKVTNAHQPDVAPLSGDFTIYGGLYRDVHLIALDPLSVTPTDDAGPGVYVKQVKVDDRSANLEITTKLRNGAKTAATASLRGTIADKDGKVVALFGGRASLPAAGAMGDGTADGVQTATIDAAHLHLWKGVADPYLYTVTVEVRVDGGRLADRVTQPLGLRYFRVDPDAGLLLDGAHYALHGVNRHQDRQGKGWALRPADHQQDYDLICAMGCTGIRLSHYQHAQEFYDLCDRGGLVVWAELPLVNSLNHTADFDANARQQLSELIKQNYNHPSILFWSLFNELGFPNWADATQWQLIVDLNALAHTLDPTRLTTAATSQAIDRPISFITDVIAVNRYPGWYGGKPTDWPKLIDDMHAKYPKLCLAVSEYGAGASITQHEDLPAKQPAQANGKWHPEEWQATVHENAWTAFSTRPYLWGTFLWAMYDFGSDGRNEGDTPGRNDKGMVTGDRATEKDAYFWYQANWTAPETAPVVHLASRRFTPRPAESGVHVKVYSNCPTVTLTVNGVPVGSLTSPNHLFLWRDVTLRVGDNVVVAQTTAPGGKTITDTCTWVGVAPTPAPAVPAISPAQAAPPK